MLSSVVCLALQYISTLSHEGTIFEKKKLLNIKCMFWFSLQLLSEIFLILRRIQWVIITNYIGLRVKYPLYLSDFYETSSFSRDFRKILKYQTPCKSVQWEPGCSTRTDGRTDMTTPIVAFGYFANASKNSLPAPQITQSVSTIKTNCLIYYADIIRVCSENLYKHDVLQNAEYLKLQNVVYRLRNYYCAWYS
jgi:hypothetical protein